MCNMKIVKINDNSGKLYYVGGIVRDEILGVENLDVDLIYEGNAIEWAMDSGLCIKQTNEPFGTVRVNIDGIDVDIASTRKEIYPKAGHLPVVTDIGCPLFEDVKRRDFTINSLYKSVKTGEIIDFTGGLDDLKNKKLKILHKNSFVEDPTRILRMLKFRMRFGFEPDEMTLNLQREYLQNVNYDMSLKRIEKEFSELFEYGGKSILSKSDTFKILVGENIYKLITNTKPKISEIDFELSQKSDEWIIWGGLLNDINKLPLNKFEQKVINDFELLKNSKNLSLDIEIYKIFKDCFAETVILYGMTVNKEIAKRYLEYLKDIKPEITGHDLIKLGIKPSKNFEKIFE